MVLIFFSHSWHQSEWAAFRIRSLKSVIVFQLFKFPCDFEERKKKTHFRRRQIHISFSIITSSQSATPFLHHATPFLVASPPFIPRTSPAPPPFPLLHFYYHISLPPPPSWCSHNLTHSIFSPPFLFLRRFQHLTICCTRTRSSAVLIFYLCFDVSLTHTLENQNDVNKATADSLWEITALLFWSKCG